MLRMNITIVTEYKNNSQIYFSYSDYTILRIIDFA